MKFQSLKRRLNQAIIGFLVGWFVCFIEGAVYYTAYGGPFTVLMGFILEIVYSFLAGSVALLLGLILLIPGISEVWRRIGYWSLALSVAGIACIFLASELGLGTVEPESNYQMMPFNIWRICILCIVFPIVNLPPNPKKISEESKVQP